MKEPPQAPGRPDRSHSHSNADLLLLWTETWNLAIAEAWRDPEFAAQLIADPKKALWEKFRFVFHEAVIVTVKPVDPHEDGPNGKPYGWTPGALGPEGWNLPPTEVTFYLPPPPAATEQAVAVMAYWFTGEALPFSTICC